MAGPYSYFFFKPDSVTILEGFSTKLSVWGVPTQSPDKLENVTDQMTFRVETGDGSIAISQPNPSVVEVTGLVSSEKHSWVIAQPKPKDSTFPPIEARAECIVDQSDLLIYAPDGNLYWVKPEMWQSAERISLDSESLSSALKPLLENEAVVANLPEPRKPATSSESPVGGRAEPITCFLLNLNSILLSYSPDMRLKAGQQDPVSRPPTSRLSDSKP
ncbi:hypothetical protein HUA74_01240 [Myxococcus sp. CA051A]|uniref:hypothetical protein n=1 Tax=unclassified Myxococcus TaxID=2648731 RepID=UPI00157A41EE|nr:MULTISPECIES: hypothetical protein [unclassified Myxococcus]NTX33618.1 hypothetical protein [Myxococcus sp. CA033]NTX59275.1 hypothetical protein [Myxococcus sp. CA051A]